MGNFFELPADFDIEERAQRAKQNFLDGYNCCQAVLLAFQDIFGVSPETIATVASGFGGGMARMREVCGTVSAMGMAAGFMSPAIHPKNMDERTANYAAGNCSVWTARQDLRQKGRKPRAEWNLRDLPTGPRNTTANALAPNLWPVPPES